MGVVFDLCTADRPDIYDWEMKKADNSNILGAISPLKVSVKNSDKAESIQIYPVVVRNGPNLIGQDILTFFDYRVTKSLNGRAKFEWLEPEYSMMYSVNKISLQPFSTQKIEVKRDSNIPLSKCNLVVDKYPGVQGKNVFEVPRILVKNNATCILLVNPTDKVIKVQKNQRVAKAAECESINSNDKQLPHTFSSSEVEIWSEKKLRDYLKKALSHIKDSELKSKLEDLLVEKRAAFDKCKKFGKFKGPPIEIIKSKEQLAKIKPQKRRIFSPHVWDQVEPQLEELEADDIIEDVDGDCLAPPMNLVFVKKKNSTKLRLCADFRNSNLVISENLFPMQMLRRF